MTQSLLTPRQVAEQLQLRSERTVDKLKIPFVRVGEGKGVKRYRQEDIDAYINSRVIYRGFNDEKEKKAKRSRVPSGPQSLGVPSLLSRDQLQNIRLANAGGSKSGPH